MAKKVTRKLRTNSNPYLDNVKEQRLLAKRDLYAKMLAQLEKKEKVQHG